MENKTVILTGSIPQCPHCEKPTQRTEGMGIMTAMYFQPVFNERGENINPDRNIQTRNYTCNECGNNYSIKGNNTDGYEYGT